MRSSGRSQEVIRPERKIFYFFGLLGSDTKPWSPLTQPAKALGWRGKNEQDSEVNVVHRGFMEEGDSILDAFFCKPVAG